MKKTVIFLSACLITGFGASAQTNTPWSTTGNIGIGTTSPSYDLHVSGEILGGKINALYTRTGSYTATSDITTSYIGARIINFGAGATWDLLHLENADGDRVLSADYQNSITVGELNSSGDEGIINLGTTDYSIRGIHANGIEIDASGDGLLLSELQIDWSSSQAPIYLGDSNHFIKSTFGQGVTIGTYGQANGIFLSQSGGNVGIGTASPTQKLHVSGGGAYVSGNVGVGTSSPTQKLHVNGGARITALAGSGNRMVIANSNGVLSTQAIPTGDNLGNHTASTTLDMNDRFISNTLRIDFSDNTTQTSASPWKYRSGFGSNFWTDERVKLGGSGTLSDANFAFEVASGDDSKFGGDVEIVGVGTITGGTWSGSDQRFKKNIIPISNALDIVKKLEGVTYDFRDDVFPDVNMSNAQSVGYIAQDLLKIFPKAVRKKKDGYYAVCYDAIIPLLSEAINEQNQLLEAYKTELDQLKKLLDSGSEEGGETHFHSSNNLYFKSSISQNRPNPFTDRTTINYQLLDEFAQASIIITDLNGTQVLSFSDLREGNGSVEVSYSDLKPGIFLYSLVIDGQIVDTKRMVMVR